MANDNQTALMMSIQRKKDKIKELEFEQRALRNFSEVPIMQNSVSDRIKLLEELVADDEKLLGADRLNIEHAFAEGAICMSQATEGEKPNYAHGEQYYNEKYGTDGK